MTIEDNSQLRAEGSVRDREIVADRGAVAPGRRFWFIIG